MNISPEALSQSPFRNQNSIYRDEMNFAEFPLASMSDVVGGGQKTLVFGDTITDQSTNQKVARKLTITGSDEYGLPTHMDDQVILGLMQLTAKRGFSDRRVQFSRRELIRELGWRDESKSYERVKESLHRWIGVTLYYEKAWWSKEESSWVDESFHILDQVTIFDRDRIAKRKKSVPNDPASGLSTFVWNEIVFASFQAGYIKQLDFELYKSLESSIAKRMFRFLDKRFYRQSRLEFELSHFAFEKLGLSRNYHTGEIKRRLLPAIAELERKGFIQEASKGERFLKSGPGAWRVVFFRADQKRPSELPTTDQALLLLLEGREISSVVAKSLIRQFPPERIQEKIQLLDWLCARNDSRVSKSPAGFLVEAIRRDFPMPRDFTSTRRKCQKPRNLVLSHSTDMNPASNAADQNSAKVDAHWEALSPAQQTQLEAQAVEAADNFLRAQYFNGMEKKGPLFEAARKTILNREIAKRIG